jgi:hypothetical protein
MFLEHGKFAILITTATSGLARACKHDGDLGQAISSNSTWIKKRLRLVVNWRSQVLNVTD